MSSKTKASAKMSKSSSGKSTKPGKASPKVIDLTQKRVELLFEIGCEEIPAGMLPRAIAELKTIFEKQFTAENLTEGVTVETFGGPRRLTAWVRGLVGQAGRRGERSDRAAEVRGLR